MIDTAKLVIVHYCHRNCAPFQNIMRLSKEAAFEKAGELAAQNPETTAFYRFADFENYYPLRVKTDEILYKKFRQLGGSPREEHPLSFVLQECKYLDDWFGNGSKAKVLLKDISNEDISFTYGDSGASIRRTGDVKMVTKQMLLEEIASFSGTIGEYMQKIDKTCHYIEVQLWNDEAIAKYK